VGTVKWYFNSLEKEQASAEERNVDVKIKEIPNDSRAGTNEAFITAKEGKERRR
jgi:hypothetical protein